MLALATHSHGRYVGVTDGKELKHIVLRRSSMLPCLYEVS
jgi:hypothetical protein